jgi:hypothetical protein
MGEVTSFEQAKVIAGGAAESVVQPAWGPDGALYYISDRSGWWNLYRWDGDSHQPVAPMDRDCAPAPWESGYRSFAFLPDGRIALIVQHGLSHGRCGSTYHCGSIASDFRGGPQGGR